MNNKKLNDEDNEVIEYYYELNNKETGGIYIGVGIFLLLILLIIVYNFKPPNVNNKFLALLLTSGLGLFGYGIYLMSI